MTPEELAARTQPWREARERLKEVALEEAALQQWRNDLIRRARDEDGMTYLVIAEAVGGAPNGLLTGERVRQICNDTERTTQ